MRKELRALLDAIEQKKQEIRTMVSEDKTTEAKNEMVEVRKMQDKADVLRGLEEEEVRGLGNDGEQQLNGGGEQRDDAELEKEYRSVFMKGIRRQNVSSEERSIITAYEKRAALHEGGVTGQTSGDASLIVPQDIQTSINQFMRQFIDLAQFVTVENVTTLSGSRVIEKDAEFVPYPEIGEFGPISETEAPNFISLLYAVKKRGGILPITNDLLQDSDQNILNYVIDWIGRKAVATRNFLVLGQLATLTKKPLANLDAIKRVLNITLDPSISERSRIITNQHGFAWMDEQKDANGRYLLVDDITEPGKKIFKGKQVTVVSNRILKTDTVNGTAPFIIGDTKQSTVLFNRKFYELASTKEGGDAFKRDSTDLRTIMRQDIKTWDAEAAVYGELDVSAIV
ncbi:phage major capsid protein [Paenibacillus taichungensis]|uniref:Phage major capsid protein n=1 Tax=Paenibacillus taichungensis TaxID=484184 RepID=A0ABX2MDN2_9BACL|nr:phage major capsid protein [Paenibacillus taichungensis]NUU53060.1 phage major capsid protein [Paenibacillus taichungensis]